MNPLGGGDLVTRPTSQPQLFSERRRDLPEECFACLHTSGRQFIHARPKGGTPDHG